MTRVVWPLLLQLLISLPAALASASDKEVLKAAAATLANIYPGLGYIRWVCQRFCLLHPKHMIPARWPCLAFSSGQEMFVDTDHSHCFGCQLPGITSFTDLAPLMLSSGCCWCRKITNRGSSWSYAPTSGWHPRWRKPAASSAALAAAAALAAQPASATATPSRQP